MKRLALSLLAVAAVATIASPAQAQNWLNLPSFQHWNLNSMVSNEQARITAGRANGSLTSPRSWPSPKASRRHQRAQVSNFSRWRKSCRSTIDRLKNSTNWHKTFMRATIASRSARSHGDGLKITRQTIPIGAMDIGTTANGSARTTGTNTTAGEIKTGITDGITTTTTITTTGTTEELTVSLDLVSRQQNKPD